MVASVEGQREGSVLLSQSMHNHEVAKNNKKNMVLIRPDNNINGSIYHPFLVGCQYSNPRRQEKTI